MLGGTEISKNGELNAGFLDQVLYARSIFHVIFWLSTLAHSASMGPTIYSSVRRG